ncbi:MAG: nuclear transport factor 2 family protein [Cyclobacteriaceae bacterium]|nr:nuclear transport factor 2 family protein [Cyclobacteriaceae bacterium]
MKLLLTLLVVAFATNSFSQIANDKELITAVVTDYIEGRNNGEIDRLTNAFLPTATLKGVDKDNKSIITTSAAEYVARHTPGRKQTCKADIAFIDQSGNIAVAKVIITYSTHAYHDYLILMRVDGKWSISDKIYYKQEF